MRKIRCIALLSLLYSTGFSQVSDSTASLYVTVGQDSYFGFYVSALGVHKLKEHVSVTLYANYWANPAFGNPTTGTDFWTEVGGGIDFASGNEKFHFNPALGFTYGKVLSGGEKGVMGDGIVPSVFLSYGGKIQTQASATYFKSLRTEGPVTTDFVWWWINSVYSFTPAFKAGILIDHFYLSRLTGSEPETLYLWMGPLIQINFSHDAVLKFSSGYDSVNDEYVKVTLLFGIN